MLNAYPRVARNFDILVITGFCHLLLYHYRGQFLPIKAERTTSLDFNKENTQRVPIRPGRFLSKANSILQPWQTLCQHASCQHWMSVLLSGPNEHLHWFGPSAITLTIFQCRGWKAGCTYTVPDLMRVRLFCCVVTQSGSSHRLRSTDVRQGRASTVTAWCRRYWILLARLD